MSQKIKNVIVVGGGSAGWLAACFIQASQRHGHINVTLVESPNIPTLGVGEGTWPSMRHTLKTIGIPEAQFLLRCHASFKQGSRFDGWVNGNDSYYHPFMVPDGYQQLNLAAQWQHNYATQSYDRVFCPQPHVCDKHLAPKQIATPDYAFVTNYGYHFDAGKLTELLQEHGTQRLGITHILADVNEVVTHLNGDIKALSTSQAGVVEGDLFIDCSGMKGLLIDKHYQQSLTNVDHVLLNNAAVAAQVPYATDNTPIQSATVATAKSCGWTWDIGLFHRRGVGMSYATSHQSPEQAEQALRQHIASSGCHKPDFEVRHLSFTPGYRGKFWHRNCLAVGMSAGFIEPLEASALAMVELSLMMLNEEFPQSREHMDILAKRFNQRFRYRWERVIDFIKLHYVLSQRNEEYWLAQRAPASIPEQLSEWLSLWRYQAPSRLDFIENEEVFSSASYQFILYGMGFNSEFSAQTIAPQYQQHAHQLVQTNQQRQTQLCQGLPTNRDYLTQLRSALQQRN